MIPGIVASISGHGGGGGGGTPKAVHFNGSTDVKMNGTFSAAASPLFSFAGWFKTNWPLNLNETAWTIDPDGNFTGWLGSNGTGPELDIYDAAGVKFLGADCASGFDTSWNHFAVTCKTNLAAGSKISLIYINRVLHSSIIGDSDTSFNVGYSGLPLWIGSHDSSGSKFTGDMCDLSFWPGVSFLSGSTIPSATLNLFITSGLKWVSPSVAIAALGTPAVMLSGDMSNFISNSLGSDGAFTVHSGSLTTATTVPPN